MPVTPGQIFSLESQFTDQILLWRFSTTSGLTLANANTDGSNLTWTSLGNGVATTDTLTVSATKAIVPAWEVVEDPFRSAVTVEVSTDGGTSYAFLTNGQRHAFALPKTSLKFRATVKRPGVFDDFTRPNGALEAAGLSTTGNTWQFVAGASFAISGNAVTSPSVGNNFAVINDQAFPATRVGATMSFVTASNPKGVVYRYVDASNYWYFRATSSTSDIVRVIGGNGSVRASGVNTGGTFEVFVTVVGNVMTVFSDNNGLVTQLATVTDSTHAAGTGVGLYSNNSGNGTWDNFYSLAGNAAKLQFLSVFLEH